MHELKKLDIAALWAALKWSRGRLVLKDRKGEPLEVANAPKVAGLYRVTWDGVEDWKKLPHSVNVMASPRIPNASINIEQIQPPLVLTIGRTTEIYGRIRQHLGTNDNSNRLFMRLKRLIPHVQDDEVRVLAQRNLLVEWVPVSSWSHRCLLERYGSVICTPLFDIDAEH